MQSLHKKNKSQGAILRRSANRTKGMVLSIAYDPSVMDFVILGNGRRHASVDELVTEFGLPDAWQHLTVDCQRAYSAISDRALRNGL